MKELRIVLVGSVALLLLFGGEALFSQGVPQSATAVCRDGTYSFNSHRKNTCARHGGVSSWLPFADTLRLQEDAANLLHSARTLRCEFPSGALVDLSDSTLQRHEGDGSEATFDAIDRVHARARLIGNIGTNDVRLIVQDGSLTFIELPLAGRGETGMVNVTVVFAQFRPDTREFFAVDSRHTLVPLSHNRQPARVRPVAEQYYGVCRVL